MKNRKDYCGETLRAKAAAAGAVLCAGALCAGFLSGCSINDLKTKKYVDIKGNGYSQVEQKDSKFDEYAANGDISSSGASAQTETRSAETCSLKNGNSTVTFSGPEGWYESTGSRDSQLNGKSNKDTDMKYKWEHAAFCDGEGLRKLFVYCAPVSDAAKDIVSGAAFSTGADDSLKGKLGAYPQITDVRYGSSGDIKYSYRTYSGEVDTKGGGTDTVSYTRSCAVIGDTAVYACFWAESGASSFSADSALAGFWASVTDGKISGAPAAGASASASSAVSAE